jgi:hypothetical protein
MIQKEEDFEYKAEEFHLFQRSPLKVLNRGREESVTTVTGGDSGGSDLLKIIYRFKKIHILLKLVKIADPANNICRRLGKKTGSI